jgi:two-component system NtrC family sensor kinase
MRSYGRPSVLIVDDEETVRAVCKRALTKAGYEPVAVATGREALAAVQRDSFDVFMIDVRMPDLDGPRLLSLLREHDPDTPCLVISGYADFDAAVACLRYGASDFVRKPFDIGTMVMAVDRVLASTHLKVDSALLAATQTIFSSLDSREITGRVLSVVRSLLKASDTAIFLTTGECHRLGDAAVVTSEWVIPQSVRTRLLERRDPVVLLRDQPGDLELADLLAHGTGPVLVQRLAVHERALGLLVAARRTGGRSFGDGDMRRAMLLAGHVALALENGRLHSDVEDHAQRLEQALDALVVAERISTSARLAAGLGHEISNPACAVLAYLELAREQLRGGFPTEAAEAVDRAAAGANAILDVCRSLRLLGSSPRPTVTDLKQVLESAIMLASYELRGRARVVLDLPPRPILLLSEQAKLGQVFLNLLLNAAAAIPPGAAHENQVTVHASAHAGEVTVRVEDTGRGVSPAILPHLFEPSVTTKRAATGHGMGLAICRWIVEEMGGHIRCIPDLKRGAAFEVRIPVEPRPTSR